MEISKKQFPKVMQDNDETFLAYLFGIIESVDELSSLEVTKSLNSFKFRIAPSVPKYTNMIIEEILKYCNLFKLKLDMSKSITTSSIIYFDIVLE